jgi:hypothetical protein
MMATWGMFIFLGLLSWGWFLAGQRWEYQNDDQRARSVALNVGISLLCVIYLGLWKNWVFGG